MLQWDQGYGVRAETLGNTGGLGTGIVSGGANVKGTWVAIGTSGFSYEYFILSANRSGGLSDVMIDIGISDGSNIWVLAADLHFCSIRYTDELFQYFSLPLHVPKGAQLVGRCAASGDHNAYVEIHGFSAGLRGRPGFSRCIALFTPTSSRGIAVDPGAGANTKVRTQIIASSAQRIAALFAVVGYNNDVARAAAGNMLLDIETGAAAAERKLASDIPICWSTVLDGPQTHTTPIIPCDVPTAERFSVFCAGSNATAGDRTIDVSLYGLVP